MALVRAQALVGVVMVNVMGHHCDRSLDDLALALQAGIIASLGGIDLLLGHINVALVAPHSVGTQVLASTVHVGLVRDVSQSAALVVVAHLQGFAVQFSLDSLNLAELLAGIADF